MNEREAARLIDYGHTEVAAEVNGEELLGVAIKVEMVPMLTIRQPSGDETAVPLEDCQIRS